MTTLKLVFLDLNTDLHWKRILKKLPPAHAALAANLDALSEFHVHLHRVGDRQFRWDLVQSLGKLYDNLQNNLDDIAVINMGLDLNDPPGILRQLAGLRPNLLVHKGNTADWEEYARPHLAGCGDPYYYSTGDPEAYKKFEELLEILGLNDMRTFNSAVHDFNHEMAALRLSIKLLGDKAIEELGQNPGERIKEAYETMINETHEIPPNQVFSNAEKYELEEHANDLFRSINVLLKDPNTMSSDWKELPAKLDAWLKWVGQVIEQQL